MLIDEDMMDFPQNRSSVANRSARSIALIDLLYTSKFSHVEFSDVQSNVLCSIIMP